MFEKSARKMPSRRQIADYWMGRPDAIEKMGYAGTGYDDEFAHDECWACGDAGSKLEKCHVHSRWKGGNDLPENLVILCQRCHVESEDMPVSTFWDWLKRCRKDQWKPAMLHAWGRINRAGFSDEYIEFLIMEHGQKKTLEKIVETMHGVESVKGLRELSTYGLLET